MMMSDSKTNRPMNDEEREALLKKLLEERYGNPTRERFQSSESAK